MMTRKCALGLSIVLVCCTGIVFLRADAPVTPPAPAIPTAPTNYRLGDNPEPIRFSLEDKSTPVVHHLEDRSTPVVHYLEDRSKPVVHHLEDRSQVARIHLEDNSRPVSMHLGDEVKPAGFQLEEGLGSLRLGLREYGKKKKNSIPSGSDGCWAPVGDGRKASRQPLIRSR